MRSEKPNVPSSPTILTRVKAFAVGQAAAVKQATAQAVEYMTPDRIGAAVNAAPARFLYGLRALPATARWILSALLILLAALFLFLAQTNWDWFRPTLASIISARIHRPVQINGHLRAHLLSWTPDATLGGLRIAQPDWALATGQPIAGIGLISVRVELAPLFIGRIVLPRLQIDKPVVALYQNAAGRANWDFSNGADAGKPLKLPAIKNFIITDGQLAFNSLQRHLSFSGTINAHEQAASGQKAFILTGQGTLNKKIFKLMASGGPLLNVRSSVPYPFDATIEAGDTRITAAGRVLHPFDLGQLSGQLSITGHDLADLYYLTGLALPNTPSYRISAAVTRDNQVYLVKAIQGRVGSSDIEGDLTVDTRNHGRPNLTGDLSSRSLDVQDLGSLFGATAANAPQAPRLTTAPTRVPAAHRLLPDASLDVNRLRGMDAHVSYRARSVKAMHNMPLRGVNLGITLDHGLLDLDPVAFSFPQGQLKGKARLDARTDVQTNRVDMSLIGVRVQDFLPQIGGTAPLEGTLNARVRATGTGNSVHKAAANANGQLTLVMPNGQIRQGFAELLGIDATKGLFQLLTKDQHQTSVRCGIADFDIHSGVMQAQNVVFDTGVVRVNGSGVINLNDERIKLALKGKPKKFRLVRINAPIVIGGHLSAPTLGVDAGPAIVQGGIAAALNSILPFLSLDLAKNADCAAVISEAQAKGARTGQ